MKTVVARLTLSCLSIIVISLMLTGISNAKIDQKSIMGMWVFDEGRGDIAKDSSENGNDGTLMNGPQWVEGKFSKALDFDGTDDFVEVPDNEGLDFGDGSDDYPFTFAAWVKRDSAGVHGTIISKYNSQARPMRQGYSFSIVNDNQLSMTLFDTPEDYRLGIKTDATIDTNWHHAATTYDGSKAVDGLKLYIDGNEERTTVTVDNPNYVAIKNSKNS